MIVAVVFHFARLVKFEKNHEQVEMASPHGGESWQCCRRARTVQAARRCQVLGELGRAEDQLLVGDHRRRGCCGRISSLRTPTGREVDGARDSRPGCTRSRFGRPEYLPSCSRSIKFSS